jgi:spore germination protein GerM
VSVVAVAGVAGLVSCGVPSSDFDEFEQDRIPFGLAETSSSQPVPPPTAVVAHQTVTLYFVREGELVPVSRDVASPASLAAVVAELVAGPAADSGRELRTALSDGLIEDADTRAGVATVAVSASFKDLATTEQRLAVAQLVVTLTGRPGVGQVAFTIDDEPVPVPTGEGLLANRPLSRDDFTSLLAAS